MKFSSNLTPVDESDIVFGRSTMQLIIYFSGFEMSTRLSVTVAWFPALEIKTGTATKTGTITRYLLSFLEKLVDIDGFSDFFISIY